MDDLTETAWRKALRERGAEWVIAQLRTRPGRPDDVVLDVVFEPPYPTRGFCQTWCGEQDNRLFRFSWHTLAAIGMLLLFLVCFCQAVASWDDHEFAAAHRLDAPMAASPPRVARGGGSSLSDTIPNQYAAPGSSSSSSSSPPSLCSYINYDTARCPQVQR